MKVLPFLAFLPLVILMRRRFFYVGAMDQQRSMSAVSMSILVAPFPSIQSRDEANSVAELAQRAVHRRELALVALARRGLTDVLTRGVQGGVGE